MPSASETYQFLTDLPDTDTMPVMFVGHGNPMNAISDNVFSRTWSQIGRRLPRPNAILCISAHWLTPGTTQVTAMDMPRTIHDFGGFPRMLFEQHYPAPGAPGYAEKTMDLVRKAEVIADYQWGLDHGTWSVLIKMFPAADIPVYQLSIDYGKVAQYHYQLAQEIKALRDKGVLIVGSGNLVHNLSSLRWEAGPYDWAIEFDAVITSLIDHGNDQGVVDFESLGSIAQTAHPTHDHFLPLIYTLGLKGGQEQIEYFNDGFDLSSISMRSFFARP